MNPPRLGSKWDKWGSRLRDFGKCKGYFKNHATSIPAFPTLSAIGVSGPQGRLPHFGPSLGGSIWSDPAVEAVPSRVDRSCNQSHNEEVCGDWGMLATTYTNSYFENKKNLKQRIL